MYNTQTDKNNSTNNPICAQKHNTLVFFYYRKTKLSLHSKYIELVNKMITFCHDFNMRWHFQTRQNWIYLSTLSSKHKLQSQRPSVLCGQPVSDPRQYMHIAHENNLSLRATFLIWSLLSGPLGCRVRQICMYMYFNTSSHFQLSNKQKKFASFHSFIPKLCEFFHSVIPKQCVL
jgi:hypothetical protein